MKWKCLSRKNIYLLSAKELEDKGKKASAVKFYEKLIKMDLEEIEKNEIWIEQAEEEHDNI